MTKSQKIKSSRAILRLEQDVVTARKKKEIRRVKTGLLIAKIRGHRG